MEYVKGGFRAATSKTAQRTALRTILLVTGSFVLLGLSSIAYILFYRNYLPDQVTTIPLHLQYGRTPQSPYAIAPLGDRNIKELQDYDVSVTLDLPRSPANTERGNFMLSLHLSDTLLPTMDRTSPSAVYLDPKAAFVDRQRLVFSSSRPALVPYTDPMVSLASRMLFLAYHIFFPTAERATLVVPMAERLSFPRNKRIPTSLLVEIATADGEPPLRTYSASITFTARLSGLRWVMYHHRLASFALFTSLFWACSLFSMVAAWLLFALVLGGGGSKDPETKLVKSESGSGGGGPGALRRVSNGPADRPIKKEEDPDDDHAGPSTPRTLATSSRGAPPSYESGSVVGGGSTRANVESSLRPTTGGQVPPTRAIKDAEDWGDDDAEHQWRTFDEAGSSSAGSAGGNVRRRSTGTRAS